MGLKKNIRRFINKLKKLRIKDGEEKKNSKRLRLLSIGICVNSRLSVLDSRLQVEGDEIQARAIGRDILRFCPQIGSWRLYDREEYKKVNADIAFVIMTKYPCLPTRVKLKILWLQNPGYKKEINEFLKQYDFVFSPSKKICEDNPRVTFLPMACEDTDFFRKIEPVEQFKTDVCFVGNYTKEQRPLWHQDLYLNPATKFNFGLWGSNWHLSEQSKLAKIARGRLEPKYIPAVYSSTKIVLANHCLAHKEEGMITTRIYEALSCEAFVISDWFKELEEKFGEHIVFSDGGKDLEEKIAYYLDHPEKREEKIKGTREKILKSHTFKNRIEIITKTLNLEFNG